jgi:hypothetical protein
LLHIVDYSAVGGAKQSDDIIGYVRLDVHGEREVEVVTTAKVMQATKQLGESQ